MVPKLQAPEDLYSMCLNVYEKLEHKQAYAVDIEQLMSALQMEPENLRSFYKFLDTRAVAPEDSTLAPKEIVRRLISYLANALFDKIDLTNISARSLANVVKLYVFLTERLSLTGGGGGASLKGIGPALAAQEYGDSTIMGNLTLKQLNEFTLPSFTLIGLDTRAI